MLMLLRSLSRRPFKVFCMAAFTAGTAVLLVPRPAAVQAQEAPCSGTVLQLAVLEKGKSTIDRFRFSLAVSGEGNSERAALDQLKQRISLLRQRTSSLIQGRLTVPPPTSYRRGGSEARPQRFVANTGVSGALKRTDYNSFLETVGGLSGVRLQGMTSMANETAEQSLQQRLMAAALRRGQEEAEAIATTIGAPNVRLLSIQRNDSLRGPRPVPMAARSSASGFDPAEAPNPEATVRMQLKYCLS